MKKLSHVYDGNKDREALSAEMCYESTPRISDYGSFFLNNFDEENEEKVVTYFIMPLYEMNLHEYLKKL